MRQHHKYTVRLGITALLLMLLGGGFASNWFSTPVRAATGVADTKGTDFWLAFGQNYADFPPPAPDLPLTLTLFITAETSTTGTVEVLGISVPFAVTAGSVTTVPIAIGAQLTENDNGVDDGAASDGVELKGVHVTAVDEVTVYGLSQRFTSTDAFLGLPTDILGQEYITLGYVNSLANTANQTQFAIVGTQGDTTVTITPSVTTGAHTAGDPFDVTLNEGETYQLQNAVPGADLTGTIITSSKPVAVFSGHSCANVPPGIEACDFLVEQLQPTSTWGRRFMTVPIAERNFGVDVFRFLAQQDDTDISVNGGVPVTINRGQISEQFIFGAAEILASKPILVAQYSPGGSGDPLAIGGGDPFMAIVPPVEQFQAGYTVTTPATGFLKNFINVVVPTTAVPSVTLDGANVAASAFTPIGTSSYSGAQLIVGLGSHAVAAALPLGITVYGFNQDDSYGYVGGMSLAPVAVVTNLALSPKEATNPLNTQHCVTATITAVTEQFGAPVVTPVVGVRVDFSVTGVHTVQGFSSTDAEGKAVFCYTGTVPGIDTITASQGSLTDTASKTWVAIDAVDDSAGPVQGTVPHVGVIPNVLTNDTLNGAPVTAAAVTLTTSVPDPTGKLTLNADGSADLAVAAAGTYTLTYQICDVLNPTNCDTALVTVSVLGGTPGISINKTTNGSDGLNIPAGAAITWTYVVKNTGDVALNDVTVTDDKLAPTAINCVGGSNGIASLVVGASVTCTATGTAAAGAYSNTGTAAGTAASGDNVSASDQSSYYGVRNLVVTKTAIPTFTRTYLWSLTKNVDKNLWEQIGGTASFTYSVVAAQTGFTDSAFQVTGQITVSNPNAVIDITGVNVTDSVNNMSGGSCAVTNGTNLTIVRGGSVQLSYSCTYTGAPTQYAGTNTAVAAWDAATHHTPSGSAAGTGAVAFNTGAAGNPTRVRQTVTVTDTFNGSAPTTLGTAGPAVDVAPWASRSFTYPRTIPMPVAPPPGGPVVPSLRLSSGSTTITVTDGGPGDANSMPGVITYVGPVGAWFMNVSTGQSSGSAGAVGPGAVELNSVNMSSVTSNPLTILFSQSNTTPGFPGWNMSFGGTLSGNGSVTYSAYADDANNLFALTSLIGKLGPYASGPFSGTVGSSVPVAAPYSLTQQLVITPNQSAVRYSGDAWMMPVAAPGGCASYPNTATIVETGQTASQTVQACGSAATGAMTIEYWQGQNGQALITAAGPATGTCSLTPWLRQFAPFQDLASTARCTAAATYVNNVIKAGKASGATMNAMLKAQMLATALDVYFSDAALGGNKIAAPAPIGGVAIDLTKIPVLTDVATGGVTWAGAYQDVSGAFGGAKSLTVLQMLTYAATRSNAGGGTWYSNVKAVQELAKNAFDAINNQMAFKQIP